MSQVLVLCVPSHGHINPVLGLAGELIRRGESVTFFGSDEFRLSIEGIGAEFMKYKQDLNIFGNQETKSKSGLISALLEPMKFVDDILLQIQGREFDYIVYSSAYPYAKVIAQVLNIPTVSSFAVFMTLKDLQKKASSAENKQDGLFSISPQNIQLFEQVRENLMDIYQVEIPDQIMDLLMNTGDLNIIYTSRYFAPNEAEYANSFLFIGPPVYDKKYQSDFPFEKLKGKKVIYISLGTVFSQQPKEIYELFFQSFAKSDAVVVMSAYKLDLSLYTIPDNFIIRDYVPQLELLKHTSVAITHAGMNSIGDILYNHVPFVSIPFGADQFFLANRAAQLGATIVLDANTLDSQTLVDAVEKVTGDPTYLNNINKIRESFVEAGGYQKAGDEIFKLKKAKGIAN